MYMISVRKILQEYFEIDVTSVIPLAGGWASLAFKVTNDKKIFFLKMYEINRSSTPKLVKRIDQYVPIMHWIAGNSHFLSGKVTLPLLTKDGVYKYEDNDAFYLLYEYIDGETIGDQPINIQQIDQLSEIIAALHAFGDEIPFDTAAIREDYRVPYDRLIGDMVSITSPKMTNDLRRIIDPFLSRLIVLAEQVGHLADVLKKRDIRMALCHTDLHNWNMIQANEQLVLIDWEGLKLAPVEADLFFLYKEPYFARFLEIYQRTHSQYQPDETVLKYYQGRRKLEDIGEFIEQLLYDPLDQKKRESVVGCLYDELRSMNQGIV